MNKVICDICGTVYPDSADNCPICGSSREYALPSEPAAPSGMPEYIPEDTSKGLFSSARKTVREEFYDADAPESDVPQDILDEERYIPFQRTAPRTSMVLVSVLTVITAIFLLGTLFLYIRFMLPNRLPQTVLEPSTEPTATTAVSTEETTEPTIPCESIVLISGVPEIDRIGQYWLLHVTLSPEDTTDDLLFSSSDEGIVTVTEEGRLCAVGEGEATVTITCGEAEIQCIVTVRIPDETGSTEAETEAPSEGESEATDPAEAAETTAPVAQEAALTETEPTETVPPETVPMETVPPTETTEAPTTQTEPAQVTLKLVQSDITFTKKGITYQLELDCDLDPADVKWMTLDPKVVICRDGVITVVGSGTTRVYASYGDQEVYCVVRVNLK